MPASILPIGQISFREDNRVFGLRQADRRYHLLAIGRTGTGKSTLLGNLLRHDLEQGEGVLLIDPHGDLADAAIRVPTVSKRIVFDPGRTPGAVTFNPLHVSEPTQRHLVVSELITIFEQIWQRAWGPRLEYILRVVLLSLTERPGHTLLDALRMLNDKDFRASVVEELRDPILLGFWLNEFSQYSKSHRTEALAPIQNKLGEFALNPISRAVLDHPEGTIHPREIMDNGHVLIANLSVGTIGRDMARLLGATLIGKFGLAALSRADLPPDERRDFYCYVDEFPLFATASIDTILSEARKYRLNLILAMQYLEQLDARLLGSVFGNVGNLIAFRVGARDAAVVAREFEPHFSVDDLVSLPHYHAYVRMTVDGAPAKPFSARMFQPSGARDPAEPPDGLEGDRNAESMAD